MDYFKCSWCNSNDVYTISKSYLSKELQEALNLEFQNILSCNKCESYSLFIQDSCYKCNKTYNGIYRINNSKDINEINSELKICVKCS
jgi:hypothetical protein